MSEQIPVHLTSDLLSRGVTLEITLPVGEGHICDTSVKQRGTGYLSHTVINVSQT